jgi:hypothetical protein
MARAIACRRWPRGWRVPAAKAGRSWCMYLRSIAAISWTVCCGPQPATGFTPHCRAGDPLAAETPIILATELDDLLHDACLVNLSNEIPPGFSRFQQLIEIISIDDEDRLPGRERFRFYRERGYPLENRDIAGGI